MIIIKVLIGLVSIIVSIYSLIKLCQLPCEKLTPRENLKKISNRTSMSGITDFVLTMIIICIIPEGEYRLGIELVIVESLVLLWGIIWTYVVVSLKQRILKYYDEVTHDIKKEEFKYINPYRLSIPIGGLGIKVLFCLVETVWIMQSLN